MRLPKLTEQAIEFVDATPNDEYPLRILKAYRQHCDCRWATDTEGNCDNPVYKIMNDDCKKRAKILDRAIDILERASWE